MKQGSVVAVVPTRKGSERVPGKNTRPFAETCLLELKLRVLKHLRDVDRIVVNTDCDASVEIAERMGVAIHRRDPKFAHSSVTNDLHWRHIAETTECDYVLLAQATSPLVRVSTFQKAIKSFRESDADSVNSTTPVKQFLWLNGRPLNYDVARTPKSQDLPDIRALDFAISLVDRKAMIERGNVVGAKPLLISLDPVESTDIDTALDFEVAEFLYGRLGFDWLLQ